MGQVRCTLHTLPPHAVCALCVIARHASFPVGEGRGVDDGTQCARHVNCQKGGARCREGTSCSYVRGRSRVSDTKHGCPEPAAIDQHLLTLSFPEHARASATKSITGAGDCDFEKLPSTAQQKRQEKVSGRHTPCKCSDMTAHSCGAIEMAYLVQLDRLGVLVAVDPTNDLIQLLPTVLVVTPPLQGGRGSHRNMLRSPPPEPPRRFLSQSLRDPLSCGDH
eukprot:316892-Rhodomonas_salina.1